MSESAAIPAHRAHVFTPKQARYCVAVGVLNEGERFREQIARMQEFRAHADILIADGGSTDGGASPEFLAGKARALLVMEESGGGLSAQYRAAIAFALSEGYAGVILVDGNGKDGMEAIPRFAAALDEGYALAQGSRFLPGGLHRNTPLDRLLAIRCVFSPLMRLCSGFPYTDAINGFKAVSRALLEDPRVQPLRPGFRGYRLQYYLNYRAPRLGMRVSEIPVSRVYPAKGRTPTKISGLRGRLDILLQLAVTLAGGYNPPAH